MTPLERAARAMCIIRNVAPDGSDLVWGVRWKEFVPEVRAVLNAIREPNERMAKVGAFVAETGAVLPAYTAMIDAMLEEG